MQHPICVGQSNSLADLLSHVFSRQVELCGGFDDRWQFMYRQRCDQIGFLFGHAQCEQHHHNRAAKFVVSDVEVAINAPGHTPVQRFEFAPQPMTVFWAKFFEAFIARRLGVDDAGLCFSVTEFIHRSCAPSAFELLAWQSAIRW